MKLKGWVIIALFAGWNTLRVFRKKLEKMFKRLKNIWSRSDSQPTEITLSLANIFLTHVAIGIEFGCNYVFRVVILLSGIYQLYCVSKEEINCRLKASVFSFAVYLISTVIYIKSIGLPTPTHYGWLVLCFASFGSMRRLILEKIHRQKVNNG